MTIRLDVSDLNAFPLAADQGEWAVPGTFSYADVDITGFSNKEQLAFRNGWLGLSGFGRASLVQVATIDSADYEAAVRALAAHLHHAYGAPDMLAALEAARQEVADACALCDHPAGTLLSIERELTEEGVVERIHVIPHGNHDDHARMWSVEEDGPHS